MTRVHYLSTTSAQLDLLQRPKWRSATGQEQQSVSDDGVGAWPGIHWPIRSFASQERARSH